MSGKVLLVGAGPGDPELLTLRAFRALQEAEVVLYDRLVGSGVLALVDPDARRIPVGKALGEEEAIQQRILELMVETARSGRQVVRLKGGDPFVFGRGGEEWEHLTARGIEVEVIPGITSAVAVPALAGIPLTCRGIASSFGVIAGRQRADTTPEWARYAQLDTLVVLMGVGNRAEIASSLIRAGRHALEPTAFIERGTLDSERVTITTLGEVAAGLTEVTAPAVMVIGEVVGVRERLLPHLPARSAESVVS